MPDLQQHWTLSPLGAAESPVHLVTDGETLCGAPVGPPNGPVFHVNSATMCRECAATALELEAAELRAEDAMTEEPRYTEAQWRTKVLRDECG